MTGFIYIPPLNLGSRVCPWHGLARRIAC